MMSAAGNKNDGFGARPDSPWNWSVSNPVVSNLTSKDWVFEGFSKGRVDGPDTLQLDQLPKQFLWRWR